MSNADAYAQGKMGTKDTRIGKLMFEMGYPSEGWISHFVH